MKVGRLAAVMILVVLAGGGALLLKKRPAVSAAPPAAAVAAEMPEPIPVRDVLSDGRYATADAGSAKGFQIGATGVVISRADYDRNRTRRAIAQFFVKTADAGSCQMEMLNATEPIRPGDFAELSKEPRGTLVIRAEPEEAEISVDGKPIGRTNVRLLLAPGTYQLAVAKRGFVTKRDDVIVRASEIVPKSYVLLAVPPPPPQTGNLFVDSEPQGALIYLDDRKVAEGKTPLTLTALTPRMYRVRLAIESFKESIQDIEVRGGQNAQTQKAVLEPSPVIIDLQSAPSEADVFIDGGPTAEGRTPFVKPYAPGPHHIKVRKPGYTDHEEDVSLTAGSHWVKFVTLEPPPAAPKYPLKVDSVPSFARVYLNGEEQGRTPFSRELSEPQVQMRVEYEGYFPANESLVLKPGEPTIREVKLTKLGTGKVSVSSFRAARLEIDGRLHPGSVSTVRRIEIPEGSRTLRFLFDDNVAVVKTISILPEAELAVHCSEDDHRKEFAQKSAYEIGAYPSAALTLDGVIQGNVSALKLLAVGQGPHQIHFQFLVPSSGAWTFEIEDRLAALQKKRIHMAFESQDLAADDLSSLAKGGPLPESSDVLIARADLPLTVAVDDGPEAESAPGRDLRITAGPRGGRRIGLHWKQSDGKGKASILIYRLKERQLFKFTLQWTGL